MSSVFHGILALELSLQIPAVGCEAVAASDPKFLLVYVMFCTSSEILDFPYQECQLNRKRGKLRELSIHS